MFEPATLLTIAATFLLAGSVKGITGLGLPTVSLGILAVALDLPTAMALLIVPSFVTNLYQASVGGHATPILQRIWPFLLMASTTVWLGATALDSLNLSYLTALLGILLITYAGLNLGGLRFSIAPAREWWVGPVVGSANGLLTGMTGSFLVPGVMFLQGIGLPRDMFVQAMGMLFTVSTFALAIALGTNDMLSRSLGLVSAMAVAPALLGMWLGQALRHRLSEKQFHRIFFTAVLLLGSYIVASTVI